MYVLNLVQINITIRLFKVGSPGSVLSATRNQHVLLIQPIYRPSVALQSNRMGRFAGNLWQVDKFCGSTYQPTTAKGLTHPPEYKQRTHHSTNNVPTQIQTTYNVARVQINTPTKVQTTYPLVQNQRTHPSKMMYPPEYKQHTHPSTSNTLDRVQTTHPSEYKQPARVPTQLPLQYKAQTPWSTNNVTTKVQNTYPSEYTLTRVQTIYLPENKQHTRRIVCSSSDDSSTRNIDAELLCISL